jgi:large subunit ribosomal protein L20
MPRVKRGVTARARHKKVLNLAKGFRGRRGNVFRVAKQAVMKAGQYAYRDRRNKKRVFRQLWIARINAAARNRPQDAGRYRCARQGCFCSHR